MDLLAVLLAAALAADTVPVQLPQGARIADWTEPLSLVDLRVGTDTDGAWVRLVPAGTVWRIEVHAADGQRRTATAPAPTDTAGREAIASLARALLRGAPALQLPALPAVQRTPPQPPVRRVAPPQPDPEPPPPNAPVAAAAVPRPFGVADRSPPDPVATWWQEHGAAEGPGDVAPTPPTLRGWTAAQATGSLRPGQAVSGGIGLLGGVALGGFRAGAGLSATGPAPLGSVDQAITVSTVGASVGLFAAPANVLIGPVAGVDRRAFQEADVASVVAVPWVGGLAGSPIGIGGGYEVGPVICLMHDLRTIDVARDGFSLGRLPATTVMVGAVIGWTAPRPSSPDR